MLHTKGRENRPAGSGEDFEGFLPYMGVAAISVICDPDAANKPSLPYQRKLHIKFGFDQPSGF